MENTLKITELTTEMIGLRHPLILVHQRRSDPTQKAVNLRERDLVDVETIIMVSHNKRRRRRLSSTSSKLVIKPIVPIKYNGSADADAQGLCLASLSLLFLFFYLKNACASTG